MAMGRGGSGKLSRNKRTETQKRNIQKQRMQTEINRTRKLKYRVRMNPNDRVAFEALQKRLK